MQSRPARKRIALEPLECRLLCKITFNGEFLIDPPGAGQGHSTIHQHPAAGVIGLQTAEARTNGVVNWQITD